MKQILMKKRNLILFSLWGVLALSALLSCGEDRWKEYYPWTGRDLWIDSVMRQDYLWYEDLPSSKELNYFQEPPAFLKSLLSPRDKGFSTVDTLDNTPVPSYGFDYTLFKLATSDTVFNALVTYVMPQSPAAQAGMQRGEWIMLVDGDSITKKTEQLLVDGGSRKLLLGRYVVQKDEEDKEIGVIESDRNVTLPAARAVADDAIPAYRIIKIEGTGFTVGYLVYNQFVAGTEQDKEKYNNLLRSFSRECKSAGVNNFVLDLRYNAGGEMECVQLLGDILVPADKLESPLAYLQYNDKQPEKDRDLMLDSQLLQGGANLNLSTLYVLTGSATAGAAEMLINCLEPYMKVVLIGQTTKGENVATGTYLNPKYPWVLRPVVCEVFNANDKSDYADGFKPDLSMNETSYLANFLPLGNPEEALLNTALQLIVGNIELPEPDKTGMTAVKRVTVKRNVRKGLIIK